MRPSTTRRTLVQRYVSLAVLYAVLALWHLISALKYPALWAFALAGALVAIAVALLVVARRCASRDNGRRSRVRTGGGTIMSLAEHEQRQLEEIERRLAEDDPRFAARLTNAAPAIFLSHRTRAVVVLLASYAIGLILIVTGVTISSVVVIVLGAVLTTSLSVATVCRAWRKRR